MLLEAMRRGRSRILWKYTPDGTYRYSDNGPWCVTSGINFASKSPLDAALAQALAGALSRWGAVEERIYPDPLTQASKYVCGEPGNVFFSLWPLVFQCTVAGCQTLHYYRDLNSLRSANTMLRCRDCGNTGTFKQVPYIFVCQCGRIETPYVPPCKKDKQHAVQLVDRKGFRESFWRCKVCKTNVLPGKNTGLGFRLCPCGKAMRGMRLDDPQSYYAQTINIVAVESQTLDAWRKNSRFDLFLAGAALELPRHERAHINDLPSRRDGSDPSQAATERALRASLEASGLSQSLIEKTLADLSAATGGDVWKAYEEDVSRFENLYIEANFAQHRQTVEYVFVRDDRGCAPLAMDDLLRHARETGEAQAESRYERELDLARSLGIRRLELIQELPLILGAYGYTRYLSDPYATVKDAKGVESRATLRPFASVDTQIPIYTARNTTEGLFFEMDPCVLAVFVALNLHMELPTYSRNDVAGWKAWLLQTCPDLFNSGESHLRLHDAEAARGREVALPSALAFGAIHSLAHALKNTAHKFVGIDGDGLAEYLFPAYGAGLIYASANVEFTLGGIDSVFRSNMSQWLGAVRDYAGLCSFDPVCGEGGGACHACMYPKFGCQHFNRTVSRSFLVGGMVDGFPEPLYGLWSSEIRQATERLANAVPA
jgi:hypothetical protein